MPRVPKYRTLCQKCTQLALTARPFQQGPAHWREVAPMERLRAHVHAHAVDQHQEESDAEVHVLEAGKTSRDSGPATSSEPSGPGGASAPTLDQIYQQIMSQKNKAQDSGLQQAPHTGPAVNISVRDSTLEQILLQGLVTPSDDAMNRPPLQIMRSNTMEHILRNMSGGKEMEEMMFDWGSLPQDKFLEGLANDMHAIDQAPPDVRAMRRTFTLERILSGAESDLVNMLRGQHPQQSQPHSGSHNGDAEEFGPLVMPRGLSQIHAGGLHRLAQSSFAVRGGPRMPALQGRGPGGAQEGGPLQRTPSGLHRTSSGMQNGTPAALATGGNPKRPKLGNQPPTTSSAAGPRNGVVEPAPGRTWSQTLHDLARAAEEELGDGSNPDGAGHRPASREGKGTARQIKEQPEEHGELGAWQQPPGRAGGGVTGWDLAAKLAAEADKLVADNALLQQNLDAVLLNVDMVQQDNAAMKNMLLQACLSKGIQADLQLLNLSLQHHRPSPMPETQAAQIAAGVLALNNGDVTATVQNLMSLALLRLREAASGGGAHGDGGASLFGPDGRGGPGGMEMA